MSIFDWVLAAVFVVGALYGLKWGLVQAVLNLVAVYVAMLVGAQFADGLVGRVTDNIDNESVATAIGYIVIFLAVFIIAQIVGKAIRALLNLVFLGWVDRLGGVAAGAMLGAILVMGVVMVTARIAYPQDQALLDEIGSAEAQSENGDAVTDRLYRELADRYGREKVRDWLTGSSLVPTVLDVRNAIPADMFGLIPGEFASALDTLDADVAE